MYIKIIKEISIERERERERESYTCMHACSHAVYTLSHNYRFVGGNHLVFLLMSLAYIRKSKGKKGEQKTFHCHQEAITLWSQFATLSIMVYKSINKAEHISYTLYKQSNTMHDNHMHTTFRHVDSTGNFLLLKQ